MQVPKIERRILFIISLLLFVTVLPQPVFAQYQYDVNNTGVSDVNGLTGSDVQPATGSYFGTVRAIADTNNAYALWGDGSNIQIDGNVPTDGIIDARAGINGAYGLYTNGTGTITAGKINGIISAIAGKNLAAGLYANQSITIGDVNGTISASANSNAYGLRSLDDSITTGAISGTISAIATGDSAFGIYANNSIITGDVNGTIETSAYSNAYSLRTYAGSIKTGLIDGIISAVADTNSAYGLYSNTTISAGNIHGAISAAAGNNDAYGFFANGSITIGDVNGTIEAAANSNAYSLRSYSDFITTGDISGEITSTADSDYAYGLSAYTSIDIGDINGVITSNAGNDYAAGISSFNGAITTGAINGSIEIDANNSAYGISSNNGSITTGDINGLIYITATDNDAFGLVSGDSLTTGNINGTIDVAAKTNNNAYGLKSSNGPIVIGNISKDGSIYAYAKGNESYGILSLDGSITTGNIDGTLYARSDNNDSFGIYSPSGSVTTGDITGYVIGYAGKDYGYGILSYGSMDIKVDGGYIVGYSESDSNNVAAIQSGRLDSHVLDIQDADDNIEIAAGSQIYGDIDLGMSGSDNDILTLSGLDANSTTLIDDLKNIETINLTGGTWHINGTVSDNLNGITMTGGVLNGTGTLGSLNVTGGTVAPGNSIGTTTVDGDFTIDSGGTLEIEVDNSGNSDKLVVTGDATINGGTLKAISTETISRTHEYTILEANNVSGQFDTLDTALLHTVLYQYSADEDYLSDSVILTVIPEQLNNPDFLMTANQLSLGNALQQIADNSGNGVTTELQHLTTLGQVRDAYDQLCGQTRTSLAFVSSSANTGFTDTVSSRLNNTHSGVSMRFNDLPLLAMAAPDRDTTMYDTEKNLNAFAIGNGTAYFASENWGMWMRGYGIFGERDSDSGSPGYHYKTYGSGFGMDFKTSKEFILGLTGGYSYGHVDYSSSRDESDITGMPMGIYGSWFSEGGYVDAIFTYAPMKYETTRYVDLTSEKLEGDFDGYEAGTYWELGRNLYFGKDVLVQPMTSFQISYLNMDNYTETGGVSALSFDEQTYKSYKGSLGMKIKTFLGEHSEYESLILELRGRWQHEFGDTKSDINANFSSNPGTIFKVSDEGLPDNSTILGIGLKQIVKQNTMYYIDYDTSFNNEDTSHIISAGLRYRW